MHRFYDAKEVRRKFSKQTGNHDGQTSAVCKPETPEEVHPEVGEELARLIKKTAQ